MGAPILFVRLVLSRTKRGRPKRKGEKKEMKRKKGFTIVELVIVIAVIAVLAAVLIPTFSSLIQKANLSSDQVAVRNMNNALAMDEVENGKPDDVEEAKKILKEAGYNADSYVALKSNNLFYWDSSENKVIIYSQEEQKVTYPVELANKYADYTEGKTSMDWYILNDKTYERKTISDLGSDLSEAITNSTGYQTIVLTEDIEFTSEEGAFPVNEDKAVSIDLNGHSLTLAGDFAYTVAEGTMRIMNGTISGEREAQTTGVIGIDSQASLTLENISCSLEQGSVLYPSGTASEVIVRNSTLKAEKGYGISTNANGHASWDVDILVENSTIYGANAGILVNVPCNVNVSNSEIESAGIGVCIRGGNATFENCKIIEVADNSKTVQSLGSEFSLYTKSPFVNGSWGTGNYVQWGGLIVGDWNSGYNYNANCTLINTSVTVNGTDGLPVVYLSQDGDSTTTLTFDNSCKFYSGTTESSYLLNSAMDSAKRPAGCALKAGTVIVNGNKVQQAEN